MIMVAKIKPHFLPMDWQIQRNRGIETMVPNNVNDSIHWRSWGDRAKDRAIEGRAGSHRDKASGIMTLQQ